MTTVLERAPDAVEVPRAPMRPREVTEHLSLATFLGWWIGPMTHATGGRGPWGTVAGLALLAPLLITSLYWRRVPATVAVLSLAVPLGALAMCLWSPSGWYGADDLASYALASLAVPAVLAYSRTPQRRQVLVAVVVLAGFLEFAMGFLGWWGGGDPSRAMVGTFYWWNPYAAYLLAPALLGAALAIRGERPWRLLGWIGAPICCAGIVLSSSRATLALLAVGFLLVGVAGLSAASGWRALGRAALTWVLVAASAAAVATLLTGPPFFAERSSATGAASARADRGESVSIDGAYRLQFWTRALAVAEDRPVFGSGSHVLATASDPLVADGGARSNYAHNGYLQALSDGGLALGGPFLLAALLAAAGLLRRVWAGLCSERRDIGYLVLPAAGLALMAHGAVDFDWSYPAQLLMTAVVVALGLSLPLGGAVHSPRRWQPLLPVVALCLMSVGAVAAQQWQGLRTDVTGAPASAARQLHAMGDGPFADERPALALLVLSAGSSGPIRPLAVAPGDLRWALDATARGAQVDAGNALLRARGLIQLGRPTEAVSVVEAVLTRLGSTRDSFFLARAADVLAVSGQPDKAASFYVTSLLNPASAALHPAYLLGLLSTPGHRVGAEAQCAAALVPLVDRLAHTPDPGQVPPGTNCLKSLKERTS